MPKEYFLRYLSNGDCKVKGKTTQQKVEKRILTNKLNILPAINETLILQNRVDIFWLSAILKKNFII